MAARCWEATSSKPSMSRSASRRALEPLVECLVLMLLTLRLKLDRLFVDFKLRDLGVKGANMVDLVECRVARDAVSSLEETPNIGYTGSTGAGELGFASGVPIRSGLDGPRGPSINSGVACRV